MYNSDPPSHQLHAWQQWALTIEQRMQEQQQTIERLEQELQIIKQQLAKQEAASPVYHVEKIEYRFDQLKVETLEGSLQIGLSTSNPEQLPMMIEDFVMQQNANAPSPFPGNKNGNASSVNPANNGAYPNTPSSGASYNKRLRNRLHHQQANDATDSTSSPMPATSNEQSSNFEHNINNCIESVNNILQQRFHSYIDRQSSLLQLSINEDHKKLIIEDLERQLPARVHYYYEEQLNKKEKITIDMLKQRIIKLTIDDIESAIDQYLYRLSQEHSEGEV